MKEELIRILNAKLNDINKNINSLMEINGKIDAENEKLSYATRILNGFKDGETYNILNFVKLSKEDFEKVLDVVDNDVEKIFSTNNCNYDGLIYLINGINNGVSLSLTDEQKNGIEYLIRGLSSKEEEYEAVIDGLQLVKSRFPISDLDVLNNEKENYTSIINKFDSKEYIDETDKICEAIEFSELNKHESVDLLTYLLQYNAEVYSEKKDKVETHNLENKEVQEESNINEENDDNNFTFNPIDSIDMPKFDDFEDNNVVKEEIESFENNNEKVSEEVLSNISDEKEENNENLTIDTNNIEEKENTEEIKIDFEKEEKKEDSSDEITFEAPSFDISSEQNQEGIPEITSENELSNEDATESSLELENFSEQEPLEENQTIEVQPTTSEENDVSSNIEEQNEVTPEIDEDFKDVVSNDDYYEEYNVEEEKTSNRELQRLFAEYEIKELEINDDMLLGNADNYKKVLETLKRNNILDKFRSNKELLREVILSSGEEELEEVLRIIKNELSVDDEDYEITLNIAINTLPSIFVKDNGNYDNFVKNVKLFKEIGINLINLFDFSKEVFIADNATVLSNYNIVKNYNVGIDYKNAKYLLMLSNIAEKMDYYVESSYIDKTKDETFDGIAYINNYAVKLNCVTDETIKRLRYASMNGKKVFGSKPNSLTGEITNLKVNALELDDNYRNSFFNNEFNGLTNEEVREYIKLTRNSSNVGNYSDELEKLNEYHNGLRYNINGILVSYNKVIRNYNILRSYGINKMKALHFAVCYNLVITKDEYNNLRNLLEEIGGAF